MAIVVDIYGTKRIIIPEYDSDNHPSRPKDGQALSWDSDLEEFLPENPISELALLQDVSFLDSDNGATQLANGATLSYDALRGKWVIGGNNAQLDSEIANRIHGDSDLLLLIDSETQARKDADSDILTKLDSEIQVSKDRDSDILVELDSEIQASKDRDSDILVKLDSEIEERRRHDSDLKHAFDSDLAWIEEYAREVDSDRRNFDSELFKHIDSEVERVVLAYMEKDSDLDSDIRAIVAANAIGDSDIRNRLDGIDSDIVNLELGNLKNVALTANEKDSDSEGGPVQIPHGYALAWDSDTNLWTPMVSASSVETLIDVDLTGLDHNFALAYDSDTQKWKPQAAASRISNLLDVDQTKHVEFQPNIVDFVTTNGALISGEPIDGRYVQFDIAHNSFIVGNSSDTGFVSYCFDVNAQYATFRKLVSGAEYIWLVSAKNTTESSVSDANIDGYLAVKGTEAQFISYFIATSTGSSSLLGGPVIFATGRSNWADWLIEFDAPSTDGLGWTANDANFIEEIPEVRGLNHSDVLVYDSDQNLWVPGLAASSMATLVDVSYNDRTNVRVIEHASVLVFDSDSDNWKTAPFKSVLPQYFYETVTTFDTTVFTLPFDPIRVEAMGRNGVGVPFTSIGKFVYYSKASNANRPLQVGDTISITYYYIPTLQ